MHIFRKEFARRQADRGKLSDQTEIINNPSSRIFNFDVDPIHFSKFGSRFSEFPVKNSYVLSEFLNFHDEAFIRNAYQGILRREPDSNGLAHYLTALRSGHYTKAEILGRLRYSGEGKAHAVRIRGLFFPFVFQIIYRIPVLGYIVAWTNFILRLPSIVSNWSRFEAFVGFQYHQQIQNLDQLSDQAEQNLRRIDLVCQQKVGLQEFADFRIALEEKAGLSSLQELVEALHQKADQNELGELWNHFASVETNLSLLGKNAENLLQQVRSKADIELVAGLVEAVEVKADRVDLQDLCYQLTQSLGLKVDRADLEEVRYRLDAKADIQLINDWGSRLEKMVDAGQLSSLSDRVYSGEQQTLASINEIRRQIADHKRNIVDQQRRLALLLEEARKQLPETINPKRVEQMVAEENHLLDAFYVSFEDCFRGTREDIKQRMEVYLPVIKESKAANENAPLLDIGCGRGEWLEILKEAGLTAYGVDLNRIMVDQCRELGFEVIEADVIDYLRSLNTHSLGAITGMHIIEHIPFKRLIVLCDEVLRTLKPGGIAIFETPNPENLITGACNFYYDPTHLNPLPPDTMRFVMEIRGFSRVKIIRLHPFSEETLLKDGPDHMRKLINERFFGAQDYAVIGYKI
ncbi:MAG: methyltransferase domain-containing protein [Candidatus Competibacter sp.]